jgi:hypothetical protein
VLAVDALDLHGGDTVLLVASGTAVQAFVPWFVSRSMLQQAAMMLAAAVTAGAAVDHLGVSSDVPGLGAWGVGLVWALLAWGDLLAHPRLAMALGSATAILGAMFTAGADAGTALTLATVALVVAAAMALRDLLLLCVGTVGLLVNVPATVTRWFPDSLAAVYGLLVVGLVLVLAAVWIARRRTPDAVGGARPGRAGDRTLPALAASGVVVLGVVGTVAVIALR